MSLNHLGLAAAADGIRRGEFTSEQLTRACLDAIAALDARIEAFAWFDPGYALEQARHADRVRLAGGPTGPLHGVPIGVKDIIDTRGIPTEVGSAVFRGHIPTADAWPVVRLREAGALVLGKTVTTEFAWANPGKTRNPWNPAHTPGGSSSGSAAGVAAGFMPAALGSQTVGSIVRPAAFCGITGYKPSYGLIGRTGVHPFSGTLDHIGALARSVADAALLASCLAGFDPADAQSALPSALPPGGKPIPPSTRAPRIALVKSHLRELADPAQLAALDATIDTLSRSGALVEEIDLPAGFAQAPDHVFTIMRSEATQMFAPMQREHPDKVSEVIRTLITQGSVISAVAYLDALRERLRLRAALDEVLAGFDVLATSPAMGEAPEGLSATGNPIFCSTWSLLGVPAINLPCALGPKGLPLGVQLVARFGHDVRLLQSAQWCEERLQFERRWPVA